jgi:hypothetical protein
MNCLLARLGIGEDIPHGITERPLWHILQVLLPELLRSFATLGRLGRFPLALRLDLKTSDLLESREGRGN